MVMLFWFSTVVLFYTFFGYPILLMIWYRFRAEQAKTSAFEPAVSVLIIVHNEQAHIRSKLVSVLAIDYPPEKIQVVVVSDGSTDDSNTILAEFESRGVVVKKTSLQRGKPANLNECIPDLSGDIVVLMDARQSIRPDVIRALLRNFHDPHIGAVSGELVLKPSGPALARSAVANGVGFYWRYEKMLRRLESGIDSSVGATGALYAIQKRLFVPIASDTLLDDMLIPLNIVRQGYRVVFESDAIAIDGSAISTANEFRRKTRTIAGNFQLLSRERWLFNPKANRIWFQTLSHKVLRLTAPVFLVLLMVSNSMLMDNSVFRIVFLMQLSFYAAALAGFAAGSSGRRLRLFSIPYAFCVLNVATVIGFARFINKQQAVAWK